MAGYLLFLCIYVNLTFWAHFGWNILLYFAHGSVVRKVYQKNIKFDRHYKSELWPDFLAFSCKLIGVVWQRVSIYTTGLRGKERRDDTRLIFWPHDNMVSGNNRSHLSLARPDEIDSLLLPLQYPKSLQWGSRSNYDVFVRQNVWYGHQTT